MRPPTALAHRKPKRLQKRNLDGNEAETLKIMSTQRSYGQAAEKEARGR